MMSFLTAVVTSRYPTTNNQLRNSSNPRQQATINNGRVTLQPIQGRQTSFDTAQAHGQILNEEELAFLADPDIPEDALAEGHNHDNINNNAGQVKVLKEGQMVGLRSKDNVSDTCAQSVEIDLIKQTLSKLLKENESLLQMVILLKNDFKKEESRNINREIALEKQIKHLDNIIFKRDQNSVNSSEPTLSIRPTNVEVPKELPKVSMVNMSLKKLKHHLANFNVHLLEVYTQLKHEIFQWANSVSNQSVPSFDQLFELNKLKAQSQEKDTVIKLIAENVMNEINQHVFNQKEQCAKLICQVNLKSLWKFSDLNASPSGKAWQLQASQEELGNLNEKLLL
ncbi:hypothetical protein Tco_0895215 [Tanacetum coccineum]|uniref:Uncharacterized protein n=1 Tax=Tanacetum coccineum TaxID=301880 RepID=A0ABQ5CGK0_9ASTR